MNAQELYDEYIETLVKFEGSPYDRAKWESTLIGKGAKEAIFECKPHQIAEAAAQIRMKFDRDNPKAIEDEGRGHKSSPAIRASDAWFRLETDLYNYFKENCSCVVKT